MEVQNKRILSVEEACDLLGFKKSYVYKLTHLGILEFTKPNGKRIYFEREKLEAWLLQNNSRGDMGGVEKPKQKKEDTLQDVVFSSVLNAFKITSLSNTANNNLPEPANNKSHG
ncbi:MAG: helix-turn-helix domain-containing protein [Ginsengibacter sp.]